MYEEHLSQTIVALPEAALRKMIRLVRTCYAISRMPAWRERIAPMLPETARFDPGHDSVMMGYDFHLEDATPRLIEINTNTGGGLLAHLVRHRAGTLEELEADEGFKRRILSTFEREWSDFCGGRPRPLRGIAILDEKPRDQFLYREMQAFARLLAPMAEKVLILDPSELCLEGDRLSSQGGAPDLIYNRHCDFYLETPAMAPVKKQYLARKICLTPNPFTYGLLGDKQRLCLLSDPEELARLPLSENRRALLQEMIPRTRKLEGLDADALWKQRKKLVFKPATRFGSQGVFVGLKMTRGRFDELDAQTTLVQDYVAAPMIETDTGQSMKYDLRLFVYRDRILGITARLYRGQVTNMRTEGGGFAAVRIV